MLGGGHVRRRSIGSMIQHSPCARVEKKKPSADVEKHVLLEGISPNKARVIEKPSIVSTTSSKFGGERMIRARQGVLERQSLEGSCLVAEGEELVPFGKEIHDVSSTASDGSMPKAPEVSFVRPGPAARSRSDTCTSVSSGTETPPLSSDASSISGGSQSSIDMNQLNALLSNVTHPVTRSTRRARARGHGHRRRFSDEHASMSSVYETIQEENSMMIPASVSASDRQTSIPVTNSVFIVDHTDPTDTEWDDDRGIIAMRRYHALKDEAHDTVKESKRIWTDTPFSLFALQCEYPVVIRQNYALIVLHSFPTS
jgi:serine/arginine repetitive matrix protein 2